MPKIHTSLKMAMIGAVVSSAIVVPGQVQADSPNIDQLRTVLEAQQRQINALKAALDNTRRDVEKTAQQADQATEATQSKAASFLDSIKIGGVAEVEMTGTEAYSGADSSDITLATVEAFIDTQPHEYLGTHVQFIYEDDGNENITLDEATFTLGNVEKNPFYLVGGKWALPFGGGFDTSMSSDPLTKDLGETKEAALLIGATQDGATLEGYFYNGDTQKSGEGDNIDQFGINAGYGGETNNVAYNVGIGYINNIGDSDGVTTGLGANTAALNSYRGGAEVHADAAFDGFIVRGNYMTTVSAFEAGELAFNGQGAKPSAWSVEGAYTMPILGKETTFAGTVQGTKEALALGLPELRVGGAVTVGIVDHFAITGEYLHDTDYDTSDGGTGNSGHTATLKLAAEF